MRTCIGCNRETDEVKIIPRYCRSKRKSRKSVLIELHHVSLCSVCQDTYSFQDQICYQSVSGRIPDLRASSDSVEDSASNGDLLRIFSWKEA